MKNKKNYVLFISVSVLTGLFSALLTRNNMNIYDKISTPPLSPPGILFPIVWTILYILMGIRLQEFIQQTIINGVARYQCGQFSLLLTFYGAFCFSIIRLFFYPLSG